MSGENIIVSGLDQALVVDADKFLSNVKSHLVSAIESKNVNKAFGIIKQLRLASQLSGLSLAQALWIIRDSWRSFDIDGDFAEVAFERIGLHKSTVREYCRVWDLFEEGYVPNHLEGRFKSKNIKDLKYIANTVSRGFDIEQDDWEDLANAPDYSTVSKKIREIKGVEPKKGSLQIYLEDDGTINAYYNERIVYVGFLDVESVDSIVQKTINRIVNGSGMIEK